MTLIFRCTSVPRGSALNVLSHTAGTSGSPTNPNRMGIQMKTNSAISGTGVSA